uniref:Uncharacterized protein n=1 Tax=Brassica campestris TaxID=3711 RepID=A0A3P6DE33_BRACM|nr:unnamed protein product [Brassica rapa]
MLISSKIHFVVQSRQPSFFDWHRGGPVVRYWSNITN